MKILLCIAQVLLLASIYSYSITGIDGTTINLSAFQGKKILIVNIATGSSYAPQLGKLETLYQKYKDSLVIIAVPSNSFSKEPLENLAIHNKLTTDYDAHFLVAAKAALVGPNQLPLYAWLTLAENNGVVNNPLAGDFQKFLIDTNGNLIGLFSSGEDPLSEIIQNAIQNK